MVVVQIEMWPQGDKTKAYSLGSMSIALKGVNEKGLRNYDWLITKFKGNGVWKRGSIGDHNPKTHGPWDLLYRILCLAVGTRNRSTSSGSVDPQQS